MNVIQVTKDMSVLPLGRLGENERTKLVFDVSDWLEEYPDASIGLANLPPHASESYPCIVISEGDGKYSWTVTSAELATEGDGKAQLQAVKGDVVVKGKVYKTKIGEALDGDADPPESWQGYVSKVMDCAAAVLAAAHGKQIRFAINSSGHLVFSYSDDEEVTDDTEWTDVDLGPVDAYAMAVLKGYTGTEEQFAQYMADVANGASNAASSATQAATSATQAAASAAEAAQHTSTAVHSWLADHVDPETGYVLDRSLTEALEAAPADLTGDVAKGVKVRLATLEQGSFDTTSDISTNSSNNGRGRSEKFTIDSPTTIIPLTSDYKYHVYKQIPLQAPVKLTSVYITEPFVIDDLTASYRILVQNASGSGSVSPTSGKSYFSLTGETKAETDYQKKTDDSIEDIEEEISDLGNIRNTVGFDMKLETELNYFSTSDLSQDSNNNGRGRTGMFKLYAPVVIQFSGQPDYGFKIYKQTFSGGTQTTEDLSSSWQYSNSVVIDTADPNANYRIMIRNTAGSSLINVDFSALYFTCKRINIEEPTFATKYVSNEQKLYEAVEKNKTSDKIVIALNTDNHYNDSDFKDYKQVQFAETIAKIAKKIGVDFIVNLGDIIEGYDDDLSVGSYTYQYANYTRLAKMANALASTNIPLIYATGHHEMFPISDSISSTTGARSENRGYKMHDVRQQMFGIVRTGKKGFRRSITDSCTDDDENNSMSFWFDYTKGEGTIRFIVVDGCDYRSRGYSNETIYFVQNALQSAKENSLPVVLMSHIPPVSAGVIGESTAKATNEDAFNTAVDGVGANIIAYLHGHTHFDNVVTDIKSYPLVGFDCQKLYRQWSSAPSIHGNPSCPSRDIDTYSEYAFDIVMIDSVTGRIDCYRFGAGDTGTYPTRSINIT